MEAHPFVMKTLLVEEETNLNGPIKQDTDWLQYSPVPTCICEVNISSLTNHDCSSYS